MGPGGLRALIGQGLASGSEHRPGLTFRESRRSMLTPLPAVQQRAGDEFPVVVSSQP